MPRQINKLQVECIQERAVLYSGWIQMTLADSTLQPPSKHTPGRLIISTQSCVYIREYQNVPSLFQGRLCRLGAWGNRYVVFSESGGGVNAPERQTA